HSDSPYPGKSKRCKVPNFANSDTIGVQIFAFSPQPWSTTISVPVPLTARQTEATMYISLSVTAKDMRMLGYCWLCDQSLRVGETTGLCAFALLICHAYPQVACGGVAFGQI